MISKLFLGLTQLTPGLKKILWNRVYGYLVDRYPDEQINFMNYGYAEQDAPVTSLFPDVSRNLAIQLYQAVLRDIALEGKQILEIGCGRGYGSEWMMRRFNPAGMNGVDLSARNISICQHQHQARQLKFQVADAENLPFEQNSFDVVVNVESSHCYPQPERFSREVFRVLRPGGFFAWADLVTPSSRTVMPQSLNLPAWHCVYRADISERVLNALILQSEHRRQWIGDHVPWYARRWMQDFSGVRDGKAFQSLKSGRTRYLHHIYQKPLGS